MFPVSFLCLVRNGDFPSSEAIPLMLVFHVSKEPITGLRSQECLSHLKRHFAEHTLPLGIKNHVFPL